MTSPVGAGVSRSRFQNLLPTRHAKWQARCAIQASGVPPGKGGDRKPANYGGFARKKPSEQKKPIVHLLLSKTGITPSKEMEGAIPGKNKKGGEKR